MIRIREIFLTQYIGAIVIGMLVSQALMNAISLLMEPLVWYEQTHARQSVMNTSQSFPWSNLLRPAITIALYVVVSYALLSWLYPPQRSSVVNEESEKLPDE